ncbi:MAG: UDP-N-acetylmuramoyl-L-alanine--D-glutamate ligase [Deinococcales bacterium]|nr:UDP-N-acetylmuramoyl-L-alanine--D-glutamate ligase [Deinococcales bacterium]
MKVLIYGLGRSGIGAGLLAEEQGHEIFFYDEQKSTPEIEMAKNKNWVNTEHINLVPADICIAAPGVPFDHPDLVNLRSRGIETIGEVEWVSRTVQKPIIGITGTAGKSTVTAWTAHILRRAGYDAIPGGNFDPPLSKAATQGNLLVAELSSFQLERCPTLRPTVSAILNLGVDHIDRHGSIENYHLAKHSAVSNLGPNDNMVIPDDNSTLESWARAINTRVWRFGKSPNSDATIACGKIEVSGKVICEREQLLLKEAHNLSNALASAVIAHAYGLAPEEITEGLCTFQGLPGRFRHIGTIGKVAVVSDSYATRPLAVHSALRECTAPIVWIAGGTDKGSGLEGLEALVRNRVVLFIGVGASGARLTKEVGKWLPAFHCTERSGEAALECALKRGLRHLEQNENGEGTVLLAPMASSFDQFRDYKHRGSVFTEITRRLERQWIRDY